MTASLFPIRFMRSFLFVAIFLISAQTTELQAQATLSIQGILKKSNGVAVDDGNYTITFKLYSALSGGTALWMEEQNNVEVSSGIYSAVLGNTTALNIPFNQIYYLGVTIGSTELIPRIQLTSAPYALSLIGVTNQFPSSGKVLADSLQVNGGILARGGAPGVNGANRNGYAFSGSGGDKDSGLFSTANGQVSLYSNNNPVLTASPTGISVDGNANVADTVTSGFVKLNANGNLTYNGLPDWRLVDIDNFESGNEGWACFTDYNSITPAGAETVMRGSPINTSMVLRPNSAAGNALRKQIDLTGIPHNYVKVKFTFFLFNSVDQGETVYAALSSVATPNYDTGAGEAIIGWSYIKSNSDIAAYWGASDLHGYTKRGEMEIKNASNTIWFILDSNMNGGVTEENYGISNIEIWVR